MDAYNIPSGLNVFTYEPTHVQGVTALVIVSSFSLIAVVLLLAAIAVSAFNTRKSTDQALFVRTHVAAYFVSLLLCDIIQSIGSIMNARWVKNMAVNTGFFCTLQGVLKQTADVGTGLWTLVIAVHTFCILFLRWKIPKAVLWTTLVSVWSAIGAIVIAGPATLNPSKKTPFFGISGYWCWITPDHPTHRVVLDYMIMFICAFASFVLYMLVFLRLRGNIFVDGRRLRFQFVNTSKKDSWGGRTASDLASLRVAKHMLLYPIAYSILILPIACSRFSVWSGRPVPFSVIIFSAVIFLLSGLVNVILFTLNKRLLPAESVIPSFIGMRISQPRLVESSSTLEDGADAYYRPSAMNPDPEKAFAGLPVSKLWNEKSDMLSPPAPMIQRATSYEFDQASTHSGDAVAIEHSFAPLALAPSRPTIVTEQHSFLQGEATVPSLRVPAPALTRSGTTATTATSRESVYDLYTDRFTIYNGNGGQGASDVPTTPNSAVDGMFSPVALSPQTPRQQRGTQ